MVSIIIWTTIEKVNGLIIIKRISRRQMKITTYPLLLLIFYCPVKPLDCTVVIAYLWESVSCSSTEELLAKIIFQCHSAFRDLSEFYAQDLEEFEAVTNKIVLLLQQKKVEGCYKALKHKASAISDPLVISRHK
jgi:hypothetical protein